MCPNPIHMPTATPMLHTTPRCAYRHLLGSAKIHTRKYTRIPLIAHTPRGTHSLTHTPHSVNTPRALIKMHMGPKYTPSLTLSRHSPNLCTRGYMNAHTLTLGYADTRIRIYIQPSVCSHVHTHTELRPRLLYPLHEPS